MNFFVCIQASNSYFELAGVFGIGTNEKMDEYETATKGVGHQFSYGMKSRLTAIEFGFTGVDLKGDISHGGSERVAVQGLSIIYMDFMFNLSKNLSVKLGYGLVSFDDSVEGEGDDVFNGAANTYSLKRDTTLGGVRYGMKYDFFHIGRSLNLSTSYTYQGNGNGHEHLVTLGLKINMQRGIFERLLR